MVLVHQTQTRTSRYALHCSFRTDRERQIEDHQRNQKTVCMVHAKRRLTGNIRAVWGRCGRYNESRRYSVQSGWTRQQQQQQQCMLEQHSQEPGAFVTCLFKWGVVVRRNGVKICYSVLPMNYGKLWLHHVSPYALPCSLPTGEYH